MTIWVFRLERSTLRSMMRLMPREQHSDNNARSCFKRFHPPQAVSCAPSLGRAAAPRTPPQSASGAGRRKCLFFCWGGGGAGGRQPPGEGAQETVESGLKRLSQPLEALLPKWPSPESDCE
eukprot:10755844-Alexandrium_andersonii.AAC.1